MEHSSEGEEWMCEWRMDINATRLMYNHICYAIETWQDLHEDQLRSKYICMI